MASVPVAFGFPGFASHDVYGSNTAVLTVDTFWAQAMSTAAALLMVDPTIQDAGALPTARDWWVWEQYVGTPGAQDQNDEFLIVGEGGLGSGWTVRGKFENANPPTYYTPRLYYDAALIGESSTQLSPATWYACRRTWLAGQVALEIAGNVEINAAHSEAIPGTTGFYMGGDVGGASTTTLAIRNSLVVRGDGAADRPSAVAGNRTMTAIESASDGTYNAWTGDETDIDDWVGGGATNDADYITPGGASLVKESFNPASVPTIGAGVTALWLHSRHQLTGAPGGAKNIGRALVLENVTMDEREQSLGTFPAAATGNRSAMFTLAPDGAAWDQDALDKGEFGMHGEDYDATIKIRCIGQAGEFLEYTLDAGDPPTLFTPRVMMF